MTNWNHIASDLRRVGYKPGLLTRLTMNGFVVYGVYVGVQPLLMDSVLVSLKGLIGYDFACTKYNEECEIRITKWMEW